MDEVIRDILSGNPERFREIVQTFNHELLRIAHHFTGDWEEARDVTQTTFIRVYRSLGRYDPGKPFRPWLFRIHLNNCRSAARRQQRKWRRQTSLDQARTAPAPETGDRSIDPALLRQIHALSDRQRTAFVLQGVHGMSTADVAGLMNCSESTVRVHLARARSNLRERLRKIGIDYE